jgi:hypothetical protein
MLMLLALPRHENCRCPNCGAAPPQGTFWVCEHCQTRFDLFAARGKCPACGAWYLHPDCPYCRETHHIDRWFEPANGQQVTPAPIPSVVDQHPGVAPPPNPEGGSLP